MRECGTQTASRHEQRHQILSSALEAAREQVKKWEHLEQVRRDPKSREACRMMRFDALRQVAVLEDAAKRHNQRGGLRIEVRG